ncbi:hypothetical protein HN789_02055 [archaeon]|jgi:hypothetical protein|nr:hypothetical protein [archaeon]MBT4021845.1 hypothetical protein [archaeon]MBT4272140.1 hypothetical protein [archaeon]MBT4460321.1 hypothetical protein [archaeon]MBT4858945.1 hypothetical protein [archaeon]
MKKYNQAIISGVVSLVIFAIVLILCNILLNYVDDQIFHRVVLFFNANIILIILMSATFAIAEIFSNTNFPINLPAPLFYAGSSVLLVKFILKIFGLLELYFSFSIVSVFEPLTKTIYPILFMVVALLGYFSILLDLLKTKVGHNKEEKEDNKEHDKIEEVKKETKDKKEEIVNEDDYKPKVE